MGSWETDFRFVLCEGELLENLFVLCRFYRHLSKRWECRDQNGSFENCFEVERIYLNVTSNVNRLLLEFINKLMMRLFFITVKSLLTGLLSSLVNLIKFLLKWTVWRILWSEFLTQRNLAIKNLQKKILGPNFLLLNARNYFEYICLLILFCFI